MNRELESSVGSRLVAENRSEATDVRQKISGETRNAGEMPGESWNGNMRPYDYEKLLWTQPGCQMKGA